MAWFASFRRAPRASSTMRRSQLSRIERHTIFREMAKSELRHGEVSKSRHRQLLRYARRLGIDPAEAIELIDDARRAVGLPVAPVHGSRGGNSRSDATLGVPAWLAISITVVITVIINLLLLQTL